MPDLIAASEPSVMLFVAMSDRHGHQLVHIRPVKVGESELDL
jgi:hypothetical protein